MDRNVRCPLQLGEGKPRKPEADRKELQITRMTEMSASATPECLSFEAPRSPAEVNGAPAPR
jgi:hypothetical protein